MKAAGPKQGKVGFTLIELLVVIAVIGILAALLFPSLRGAQKGAQVSKCTNNMHQIWMGFEAYLGDHRDVMPQRFYQTGPSGIGVGYFNVLAQYTGNNNTDRATSIYVCPTHTNCDFPSEPSYGMNWYYDNTSVNMVPRLTTTIMLAESAGPNGTGSNRADMNSITPGQLDPGRHSGNSNYLFFDGHIEKLEYSQTTLMWGTDMGNHDMPAPVLGGGSNPE